MSVWFCLASGPSMCAEDAQAVRGHGSVIAINNTLELAPFADVHYSCDAMWWRVYGERFSWYVGERVALSKGQLPSDVRGMEYANKPGLGETLLHCGNNSGYQAINLAYLRGAKVIVLLGYDMQDAGKHWHEPHPAPLANFSPGMPELCAPKFTPLAYDLRMRGVRVVNASRRTALECFERVTLSDALAALH